jgi:hypothetical protein
MANSYLNSKGATVKDVLDAITAHTRAPYSDMKGNGTFLRNGGSAPSSSVGARTGTPKTK